MSFLGDLPVSGIFPLPTSEFVSGRSYPDVPDSRTAPQVGRAIEFPKAAIRIGENRVGPRQAIGFEIGDAGKAAEEGLEALHHDRAPGWFSMGHDAALRAH